MLQKGRATSKPRLAVLLIAVTPLALVIATACRGGGDDALTLEEYFQQLEAILETDGSELGRLQIEFLGGAEGPEAEIEAVAFRDYISGVTEHFRRAIADLESIDPPPPVNGAHDNYIAARVEALNFFAAINDRAGRAGSLDEFLEVVSDSRGPASREIADREDEWCFTLQRIAVRNGIEVDLGCFE